MFGQYAQFIIPAYAITAAVVLGLIGWSITDYRARLREIADLERRGVRRRSQDSSDA